jgi:hypothetical protein
MALPLPRRTALIASLAVLACCSPPEDYERRRQQVDPGEYLPIKPLDELVAIAGVPEVTTEDTAAIQARAAGLQSRAANLPATATDPETRARLDAAISARTP